VRRFGTLLIVRRKNEMNRTRWALSVMTAAVLVGGCYHGLEFPPSSQIPDGCQADCPTRTPQEQRDSLRHRDPKPIDNDTVVPTPNVRVPASALRASHLR